MKDRFKLISAVHLFLTKGDKILLSRRMNTGYEDGNYGVIAGHLDGGESVTAAMVREAEEEAGIIIVPSDLRVAHVMHRTKDDGERIDFFLTAKTWQGEPTNKEPHKCDDLSWFEINHLPSNVIPYVKSAIQDYSREISFSEFGWK